MLSRHQADLPNRSSGTVIVNQILGFLVCAVACITLISHCRWHAMDRMGNNQIAKEPLSPVRLSVSQMSSVRKAEATSNPRHVTLAAGRIRHRRIIAGSIYGRESKLSVSGHRLHVLQNDLSEGNTWLQACCILCCLVTGISRPK